MIHMLDVVNLFISNITRRILLIFSCILSVYLHSFWYYYYYYCANAAGVCSNNKQTGRNSHDDIFRLCTVLLRYYRKKHEPHITYYSFVVGVRLHYMVDYLLCDTFETIAGNQLMNMTKTLLE